MIKCKKKTHKICINAYKVKIQSTKSNKLSPRTVCDPDMNNKIVQVV